jgi:hypothetical protein
MRDRLFDQLGHSVAVCHIISLCFSLTVAVGKRQRDSLCLGNAQWYTFTIPVWHAVELFVNLALDHALDDPVTQRVLQRELVRVGVRLGVREREQDVVVNAERHHCPVAFGLADAIRLCVSLRFFFRLSIWHALRVRQRLGLTLADRKRERVRVDDCDVEWDSVAVLLRFANPLRIPVDVLFIVKLGVAVRVCERHCLGIAVRL